MDNKEKSLIESVNSQLALGKSITEIEKYMHFGKDTLRKKMRKLNYKYDRKQKLYVLDTKNNTETTDNIKNNTNTKNNNKRDLKIFDENEIKTLKEIIKSYEQKKSKIKNLDYKNSKVVVRSFRSYEKILDTFASFCKQNELNQKDAIATALLDFIKKKI